MGSVVCLKGYGRGERRLSLGVDRIYIGCGKGSG